MAASTTPAADRRAFYPCFDGLRAIAAIAVVMHHAAIGTAFSFRQVGIPLTDVHWPIGKYFAHMDAGVTIFFLISGFLLYRPFVASAFDERAPMGPRRFFRHRFLRIFPAYWVAFICITLFVGLSMPIGGRRSLVEYFLLLHLYDPQHGGARALGGISQSWTLVVEISFYLFLPLYAYVMRRVGGRRELRERFRVELLGLLTLVTVSVAWRAFIFWGVPRTSALHELGQYWLIAQLDLFALGMGLALIRTWLDRRDEPVAFFEMIGRHDLLWWFLALVPFQIVSMHIGLAATLKPVTGGQAYLRQSLYGATALFLLLPGGVRLAGTWRDPALPAARAGGVPRHDLLRHLPVAPGVPEEGAPVVALGPPPGGEHPRRVPRQLPHQRRGRARAEHRRCVAELVLHREAVAPAQGQAPVRRPPPPGGRRAVMTG